MTNGPGDKTILAMADLFGVHYLETTTGAKHFAVQEFGGTVCYAANRAYVKVLFTAGASVAGAWDTGDPAMVIHRMGKGMSCYLSLKTISKAKPRNLRMSAAFCKLVNQHTPEDTVSVLNAPRELEVQIREKEGELRGAPAGLGRQRTDGCRACAQNEPAGNLEGRAALGPRQSRKLPGTECMLRSLCQYDMFVLTPER